MAHTTTNFTGVGPAAQGFAFVLEVRCERLKSKCVRRGNARVVRLRGGGAIFCADQSETKSQSQSQSLYPCARVPLCPYTPGPLAPVPLGGRNGAGVDTLFETFWVSARQGPRNRPVIGPGGNGHPGGMFRQGEVQPDMVWP